MPLTAVAPDFWTHVHRQRLPGGAIMQARMNVVRLGGGALLVHSQKPRSTVRWLPRSQRWARWRTSCSPNYFHHLHVAAFLARFPGRQGSTVPGLAQSART